MANENISTIECNSVNPGFVVKDILAAADFYKNKLGFRLDFTWGEPAEFAALTLGKISVHLLKGEEKSGKGFAYFAVENVDEVYQFHKDNGVEIVELIANKPYDMRDYYIRDLYGNILGFGHYIMPTKPELKIERTEITVRLEKRLAALLNDLAALKGMDMTAMLEETLLHSFEPWGDGVASPHSKAHLKEIQELKKKHGIDYDVHASYRFVE
jgi:catechol 2,3-dioxygenase-like lactoylglutathione lyase family enzyme